MCSFSFGLLPKQVVRNFSTKNVNFSTDIKPEIIYDNADTQKSLIFRDNKGKSGIYRWINNLNGDSYIGSGVDLNKRLSLLFIKINATLPRKEKELYF